MVVSWSDYNDCWTVTARPGPGLAGSRRRRVYTTIGLISAIVIVSSGCATVPARSLVASQAADIVSTQLGVHGQHHEVNPFLPDNHWGNAGLQVLTDVAIDYVLSRIQPVHPKLVYTLQWLGVGVGTMDTVQNLKVWRMK